MDYYTISKILTVILVFVTMCSAYTTYRLRLIAMFLAHRLRECVYTTDKRLELLHLKSQNISVLQFLLEQEKKRNTTIHKPKKPTPTPTPTIPPQKRIVEEDSLYPFFKKESVLLPHTSRV